MGNKNTRLFVLLLKSSAVFVKLHASVTSHDYLKGRFLSSTLELLDQQARCEEEDAKKNHIFGELPH